MRFSFILQRRQHSGWQAVGRDHSAFPAGASLLAIGSATSRTPVFGTVFGHTQLRSGRYRILITAVDARRHSAGLLIVTLPPI